MSPYARHCAKVDVQTRFVPKTVPRNAGTAARARWPSMAPAADCHQNVMLDDKICRTISPQCWEPRVRIADMDASGVHRQVLSPMAALLNRAHSGEGTPLGVSMSRVNTVDDLIADPQPIHNKVFVDYRDDAVGTVRSLNFPIRFEKTPTGIDTRAPRKGEDTKSVLAALDMPGERIEVLEAANKMLQGPRRGDAATEIS